MPSTRRLESLAGELPAVFFVKNSSIFGGELLEDEKAVVDATGAPPSGAEDADDLSASPKTSDPGRAPLPADRRPQEKVEPPDSP